MRWWYGLVFLAFGVGTVYYAHDNYGIKTYAVLIGVSSITCGLMLLVLGAKVVIDPPLQVDYRLSQEIDDKIMILKRELNRIGIDQMTNEIARLRGQVSDLSTVRARLDKSVSEFEQRDLASNVERHVSNAFKQIVKHLPYHVHLSKLTPSEAKEYLIALETGNFKKINTIVKQQIVSDS